MRLGPSGHLLQGYGLARSESAGDGCLSPQRQGEHIVDDPRSGHEQVAGVQPLCIYPRFSRRPALHEEDVLLLIPIFYHGNALHDGKISFMNLENLALCTYGDHDPVFQKACFGDSADDVSFHDHITRGEGRVEMPFGIPVQRECLCTPGEEVSDIILHGYQGPLDTVEDTAHNAGTEFHHEDLTGSGHRLSHFQSGCIFIDLDHGLVVLQADNFTGEPDIPHFNNLIDPRAAHILRNHHGSRDLPDLTHVLSPSEYN